MVIYIVEEILDEKRNLLGHDYILVKWKNFPSAYNSWIQKEEMAEIENDENDVPQLEEDEQPSNFISDSDVSANVLSRRSMVAYYKDIIIENYLFQALDLESSNYLLVWNYQSHLYVILVFNKQVWVADGVNEIKRNKSTQRLIRKYISKEIKFCNVGEQQSGEDHCGSSAVLICLEFLRLVKHGSISETLIFPVELKKSLVKKLHPLETKKLGPQSNVQKAAQSLICSYCSQSFKTKGSRRLKTRTQVPRTKIKCLMSYP